MGKRDDEGEKKRKKKEIEKNENIYSRKIEKGRKELMKMEKKWSYKKKNIPKWNETEKEKKNQTREEEKKKENMDWIKNRVKCLVNEVRENFWVCMNRNNLTFISN